MNCFLASASSQSVVGPFDANHASTPASSRCRGGLCCSTKDWVPSGQRATQACLYIIMVVILSPSSRLCGASKHLGVLRSGFHQHPNTTAPRCSCFPLSLGSNPCRSQCKEDSELSSPPVHAKRKLPAHLDLHAVMQPFGVPAANWRVWVSAQPNESSKARGAAELCCVTF